MKPVHRPPSQLSLSIPSTCVPTLDPSARREVILALAQMLLAAADVPESSAAKREVTDETR